MALGQIECAWVKNGPARLKKVQHTKNNTNAA
jgi:hypothetical protein